jgi:ribosomal protein S18 acetylase RimI-like enzyme
MPSVIVSRPLSFALAGWNMNIRNANNSDQHRIAGLFRETAEFHSQNDPIFTLKATGHERYAVWFIEQIKNDSALPLVAESDDKIVGFSLSFLRKYPATWLHENYGEINDISVTREYQRKGIGTKLVRNSIEWFKSKGIKRSEVKIATSNEVSSKFWRKIGMASYLEIMYMDISADDKC